MRPRPLVSIASTLVCLVAGGALAAASAPPVKGDRILVKVRPGVTAAARQDLHGALGGVLERSYRALPGWHVVRLPPGAAGERLLRRYREHAGVLAVELDGTLRLAAAPNDALFANQWSLQNTGQSGGLSGADIGALGAWDVTTGSLDVVVGVIDTGIDYTHEDLQANVWTNPLEIPGNGVDDDQNGYIDDVHGINAISGAGDPMDDHDHGTIVAGVIAAHGNNGVGLAGVAWRTTLIGCKAFDRTGNGYDSDAIECLDYFLELKRRAAAPVAVVATNNSYIDSPYMQAFADALAAQREAGIVFVAAAGNAGKTNDTYTATYPASYVDPIVIAVAATDRVDDLWPLSNRSATSVHLGAPGVLVWGPALPATYQPLTGTSLAAPNVTGVIALLAAAWPADDWRVRKSLVLAGGKPLASLEGNTLTGRGLRAWGADGTGALSCVDRHVLARTEPRGDRTFAARGVSRVMLGMLAHGCVAPDPAPVATVPSAGVSLPLRDDGAGEDLAAGDGMFRVGWPVPGVLLPGAYEVELPAGSPAVIQVVDRYRPAVLGAESPRAIAGTRLALSDEQVAAVDAPFPVRFAGSEPGVDRVHVTSNGTVVFGAEAPWATAEPLPSVRHEAVVAPFWDDLDPGAGGGVYSDVVGTAPFRELVIEWRAVPYFGAAAGATATFQVVFFEATADILFVYQDVQLDGGLHDGGGNATIGVQVAADAATGFAFRQAVLTDGMSLRWVLNRAPVARVAPGAGVRAGADLVLDATASFDPEGSDLTFEWTQLAGPIVSLIGPRSPRPSFVAPESYEPLTFRVVVSDPEGAAAMAEVVVATANIGPTIDLVGATSRTTNAGVPVPLEVVLDDVDGAAGGPYVLSWDLGDGTTARDVLADVGTFRRSQVYDTPGDYAVVVEVSDRVDTGGSLSSLSLSAATSVNVHVDARPREPPPGVYPAPRGCSSSAPVWSAALVAGLLLARRLWAQRRRRC